MAGKHKTSAPVQGTQRTEAAFVVIMEHNFRYLSTWEGAARDWEDIEGVHQVRVTLRRMRSALRVFRPAIPRAVTAHWSDEMGWAAGETGMARDLDVFISEGLAAVSGQLPLPGEDKLTEIAGRHRAAAYEQVSAMLDSERYARFKREFPDWLTRRGWQDGDLGRKQLKRLDSPVTAFSREVLDRHERRVLAAGTHVDPASFEQMHKLRIECKKLRYAAEFFTPLFAGMGDFIGHMKVLQDLLGVIHDVAVMPELFARLLEDETDPDALQYAGGLAGWRACQHKHLLESFDDRWDAFVSAKHPWWKKVCDHG